MLVECAFKSRLLHAFNGEKCASHIQSISFHINDETVNVISKINIYSGFKEIKEKKEYNSIVKKRINR